MSISVDKSIRKAKRLAKSGDIRQAASVYNAVLAQYPQNQRALQGLNLFNVHAHRPSGDDLNTLLALSKQKQEQAVRAQATLLLRQFPDSFELYNTIGAALANLGRFDDAIAQYRKATKLNPAFAGGYYNLGAAYRRTGRLDEAVASYKQALALKPEFIEARLNLGAACKLLGRLEDAAAHCRKAIALNPDYAPAYNNLGDALIELEEFEEAIAQLSKALKIDPHAAQAHNNLGNAYKHLGRQEEAVASYTQAIALKSDYADAHNNLAAALTDLGRKEEAIASYERALEIAPGLARAHRNLSTIKTYASDDPQFPCMERMLEEKTLSDADRAQLNFALGKAKGDLDRIDEAFAHYADGNRLRKQLIGYDIKSDEDLFATIISGYTSLKDRPYASNQDGPAPIFIVGMPRSGTSLAEQILVSHSKVHGAGELGVLEKGIKTCGAVGEVLTQTQAEELARYYQTKIAKLNATAPFVTDKMPLNFRWIGHMAQAFPDAKIIHVERDARATGWSIFKHYFATGGNGYAYDLCDIAKYYGLYQNMMAFWEKIFPQRIHHLNYERLTENQEEETRKLLSYAGLEWEDACLHFHRSERAVATASALQVKRALYKGSSEDWRRYETHLQPLIDGLQDN